MRTELIRGWTECEVEVKRRTLLSVRYRVYQEDGEARVEVRSKVGSSVVPIDPAIVGDERAIDFAERQAAYEMSRDS